MVCNPPKTQPEKILRNQNKIDRPNQMGLHLRIPSVVLDHVGQFDNKFAFLVLLTRFERVFLSIKTEM